ncbi:Phosphoesterase family [Acididesulfobacillus acetoxydans]|uniref:Phosphoesterase n=1 Tax=Acididesulfobacillus acetoxydans TaxID=1561005 RepID=A0A8S0VYD1_9FIRM|nr:alkaline phosphatase family protein [Acididesulfobacillus acetoxydans]CAA7602923.1 Phosphoesterase family [Acididesulfobacillus acetoxydans]CEJ05805.1 Phosphoesterase [Acididesulfobacillus acetoxydans]
MRRDTASESSNESFDHYFGTYPVAKNPAGEPPFYAAPGTPTINGLSAALLSHNPNQANPQRLDRSQAHTVDFDHGYTSEQKSFDGGLMDKFVQNDGHGNTQVMDYYDGNTVTAFWNYAQHFAMNDNYFGSNLAVNSSPGMAEHSPLGPEVE